MSDADDADAKVTSQFFRPRFCPACGERLDKKEDHMACPACRRRHYQNAKPCVGGLVLRDGRLMLVKRGRDPFVGWWDVPGGFLNVHEHPENAVRRELLEETGLIVEPGKLIGIYLDTYQFGEDTHATLNLFYECAVVGGVERFGDDAIELKWFALDALPTSIAFASARKMLVDWRLGQLAD